MTHRVKLSAFQFRDSFPLAKYHCWLSEHRVLKDKLRCEEAMLRFRTFLESRGSAMSESSPHLHYYALPYVSKLREHQTFGRIFNEEWLETLRKRLESFIDDAFHLVELNTAKTKPSRLSYLYVSY